MLNEADSFLTAYQAHDAGDWLHAAKLYTNVLESQPQHHQAMFHFGRLCHEVGRHRDAREMIQRAIQLAKPADAATYRVSLAATLLAEGRAAEALAQCELARSGTDPDPELLRCQSRAFAALDDLQEAADCLSEAIAAAPADTSLRFELAELLERQGHMAAAVEQYEWMLAEDRKDARAVLRLSSLMMAEDVGIDDAWLQRIGTATNFADSPELRVQLKFILAHAYDQRGDATQAALAYERANQDLARELKIAGRAFDERQLVGAANQILARRGADASPLPRVAGNGDLRPIFLIGMPCLALQSLGLQIAALPGVVMIPGPSGFDQAVIKTAGGRDDLPTRLAELPAEAYQHLADQLRRELFMPAVGITRALQQDPLLVLYIDLVARLVPRAQFISLDRPADRIVSECYHQPLLDSPLADPCTDPERLRLLVDNYQRLVEHWTDTMPPDRWLRMGEGELQANDGRRWQKFLQREM